MNILLDTHIALWAITDNPKLREKARGLIESPKNTIWISAASIWEIAIKRTLSRGDMPVSSEDAIQHFHNSGYRLLSIQPEHASAVETLPPHHQDPFDRMLVAQSLIEPMRLITHDPQVARYSDAIFKI